MKASSTRAMAASGADARVARCGDDGGRLSGDRGREGEVGGLDGVGSLPLWSHAMKAGVLGGKPTLNCRRRLAMV